MSGTPTDSSPRWSTPPVVAFNDLGLLATDTHTHVQPHSDSGEYIEPHRRRFEYNIGGQLSELTVDGLVFMGARVYDPDTRCFLTKDPNPPVPAANGSFASPYEYAWSDPVNQLDPSRAMLQSAATTLGVM